MSSMDKNIKHEPFTLQCNIVLDFHL